MVCIVAVMDPDVPGALDESPPERPALDDDIVLLLAACAGWANDLVLAEVRSGSGADISFRDGYVFQHLIPGPLSITELADRLAVSQQAASKTVADLERRGLVERRADPDDGRARLVHLAARGQVVVEAGRAARRQVAGELADLIGPGGLDDLRNLLGAVATRSGALDRLRERRTLPEDSR